MKIITIILSSASNLKYLKWVFIIIFKSCTNIYRFLVHLHILHNHSFLYSFKMWRSLCPTLYNKVRVNQKGLQDLIYWNPFSTLRSWLSRGPLKNPWTQWLVFILPFVISVFVAVLVSRYNVHQQDIFSSGVQTCHLHFVTWEHSSVQAEKNNKTLNMRQKMSGLEI